jgi:hypothetical protein
MTNIQPITTVTSGSAFVPTSRILSINGVAYDLTTDRSWTISTSGTGTVTSVGLSASMPTGLSASIIGSPITTSGILELNISFASGYSIPTNAKQSEWDSAYSNRITSLTTTGDNGSATLISNTLNIPTYTLSGLGGMSNPFSAGIGQIIYSNGAGAPLSLSPNTTTTKKYLSMTGDGTSGAAPVWDTIPAGISGSGTTNYLPKFTSATSIGNSIIAESSGLATIYGNGQVYKGQSGAGLTSFFITNDDNTFGNRHETKISTQAYGSGIGRTVIQAASYNTSTNRGELAILTESGANFVANIGTLLTGSDNAFSLYNTIFTENIRLNTGGDSFFMGTNVGIGILLPTEKLHVSGNAIVTGTLTANTIVKSGGTASQILAANGSVITAGSNITISAGTISATNAVSSVFGRTGAVVAVSGDYNTSQVTENSANLYYTEARVNANANVAANTAARHNAVTLGTANGLTLSTQQLSLGLASTSSTGALSSTDWNTFNNKQSTLTNPITGTGAIGQVAYFTGSTTQAGNNNLFWDATNNRLGVNTNSPTNSLHIVGTSLITGSSSFGGAMSLSASSTSSYIASLIQTNTTAGVSFGLLVKGGTNSSDIAFIVQSAASSNLFRLFGDGQAIFSSSVTGTSFIKTGGTSSEILAANGTVITSGTNITISGGVISSTNNGTVTSVGLSSSTSGVTIGSSPITTSGTITLSIATASGSQNGLLSSTDWSTFNSKQAALTNPITGTGTTNNVAKFTASGTIGNSQIIDDGATVFINETLTPNAKLAVLQSTDSRYSGSFRTSATTGASYGLRIQAGTNSSDNTFDVFNQAGSTYFTIRGDGNIGIGTSIISSTGSSTISVRSGTAPSTNVVDSFQMYSNDITAGNAAPHFKTENGAVIKLYQETTGVGNSIFSQGGGTSVLDDSTFDGYTLRQIVKALRNQGILQ